MEKQVWIQCPMSVPWRGRRRVLRTKKTRKLLILMVARPGIEPGTQGFSVLCSTD